MIRYSDAESRPASAQRGGAKWEAEVLSGALNMEAQSG